MAEQLEKTEHVDENTQVYPSRYYGWFVVILLTITYIFSYIDRQVLAMLTEDIKADFGYSDQKMALLTGTAFMLFYATMGIPLGWLSDRKPRKWIIAVGVFVWSIATALSGVAKSFAGLFLARVAVGAGEATLSPAAMSLISDLFKPESRAKAIGVYSTALGIGSGIAYLLISGILEWAGTLDLTSLATFGIDRPWQVVFLVVGFPGIFLALIYVFLKEPERIASKQAISESGEAATIFDTMKFLKKNWVAFIGVMLMVSVMTVVAYTGFWLPSLFARTWGWDPATFSYYNGSVLIILAPVCNILWGILIDKWSHKGRKDAAFRFTQMGLLLLVPTAVIFPLVPDVWTAFFLSQVSNVGITMVTTGGITALLAIVPGEIRGQTVALYYMVISIAGLFVGPNGVAYLTNVVFADESLIRYSMALIPILYGGPIILFSFFVGKAYRKQLEKV
ncbi:MFS transporter [Temperatibacter marinus]|uniref:MFS transporter n=1 Tax=Temperatibacter marinus TaxID=1456591 RepID=A0AA52H9S1_9PROT|nr:MFS transporter [Temperatibacter marinus]WND03486.1 MFS transporter [Temperatibacter marinus]